jgi:hypothetical protein
MSAAPDGGALDLSLFHGLTRKKEDCSMATVNVTTNLSAEGTHLAHWHACERCRGLYMQADDGECDLKEHDTPSEEGIIIYGYCDAVCYRGDRAPNSREGQQVAEGSEP